MERSRAASERDGSEKSRRISRGDPVLPGVHVAGIPVNSFAKIADIFPAADRTSVYELITLIRGERQFIEVKSVGTSFQRAKLDQLNNAIFGRANSRQPNNGISMRIIIGPPASSPKMDPP